MNNFALSVGGQFDWLKNVFILNLTLTITEAASKHVKISLTLYMNLDFVAII